MRPTGLYAGLTSQITKKFNKSLPFKFLWCPINKYVHIKIMAYLYICIFRIFKGWCRVKTYPKFGSILTRVFWPLPDLTEIIWRIIPNKNPNYSYLIFSSKIVWFFSYPKTRKSTQPIPNFFYSSLIMMTADDEKYVGNVIWFHCYFNSRGWFWIIRDG